MKKRAYDLTSAGVHTLRYTILNTKLRNPRRKVTVAASPEEIERLASGGFLVRDPLLTERQLSSLRSALTQVLESEKAMPELAEESCFGGAYVRHLIDKHRHFRSLLHLHAPQSIARAVLGPQIRFDEIVARVVSHGKSDGRVPWHIHLRVIPRPTPPFFCYPQGLECLCYLDDITERSGPLCVLPGSHRKPLLQFGAKDHDDKPGQVAITLKAGAGVLMHPNLWHKTLPSQLKQGARRLVIFGYYPSWVTGDERTRLRPAGDHLGQLRRSGSSRTRELVGEFYWG